MGEPTSVQPLAGTGTNGPRCRVEALLQDTLPGRQNLTVE
jgi:hypothetical protein